MVDLDSFNYKTLDAQGMIGQLYGLPGQCLEAWQKAKPFSLPDDYKNIDKLVILGMGGSAIGGDLLRSLVSQNRRILVTVSREYDLPSFVDDKTLVIASSYSGNTEETLTAFSQCLQTDCKKLVMTTGGKLKSMAQASHVPVFVIEHAAPPRAALGYSFMPLLAFLSNLGFVEGLEADVNKMVATLKTLLQEWNEKIPTKNNIAKKTARSLQGKIAVIYGAGMFSEVAHRWKTQINENSKAWAFYEALSELNHNAIAGYQFPKELVKSLFVIFLRSQLLNPHMLARYQVTMELLQHNGVGFAVFDAYGEEDLSRMMSLVYLGDWVSYYLAILYQIDPTPVKAIDYLKEKLSHIQSPLF